MTETVALLDRVGDGLGEEALAGKVADAIPFIQYAIKRNTYPNNLTRMPSNDPIHWLAASNCGVASSALQFALGVEGIESELMGKIHVRSRVDDHRLLQTNLASQRAWIDPTALQFLSNFGIEVEKFQATQPDDYLGEQLPTERVLIFSPEDGRGVAEWMRNVVHRYWQTKTLGLYATDNLRSQPVMSLPFGTPFSIPRTRVANVSVSEMEDFFAGLYDPNNFEPVEAEFLPDSDSYARLYDEYQAHIEAINTKN